MIKVSDKDTGAPIGTITEQQLKFLQDQLEEESREDQDYYINENTVDMFAIRCRSHQPAASRSRRPHRDGNTLDAYRAVETMTRSARSRTPPGGR